MACPAKGLAPEPAAVHTHALAGSRGAEDRPSDPRHASTSLLELVVTTEFTIFELAYSRPGSLPRACAPTGPRSTGATTYKVLGLSNLKD